MIENSTLLKSIWNYIDFMTMVRIWKEFLSQGSLKRWNVTPSNYSKVALIGWMNSSKSGDAKSEAFYLFSRGIWCSSFYNVVLIDDVEDEIMKHRKWEFDKKEEISFSEIWKRNFFWNSFVLSRDRAFSPQIRESTFCLNDQWCMCTIQQVIQNFLFFERKIRLVYQ